MLNEMSKWFNRLSVAFGYIGGIICYFLGGWDKLLSTLITLIVIDYGTGVIKAMYKHELSSSVGFRGILKKVIMLTFVIACVALQNVINLPIREIVIMFFICNEGISIIENTGEIIPIPDKLKNVLQRLRDDETDKIE